MSIVTAERVGNRVHVTENVKQRLAPEEFDRRLTNSRAVMGGRWSKKAHAWTYPLDLEVCRDLREVWGNDLTIGPKLHQWAWSERERENALNMARALGSGDDAYAEVELDIVPQLAPFMWRAMQRRPYQAAAAKFIAYGREVLCADQPGIGKTIEALAGLIEGGVHHGHVLILAPRTSTVVVWQAEIHRWLAGYKHGATTTLLTGLNADKMEELVEEYLTYDEPGLHFLIANAEVCRIDKSTFCPDEICSGDEDWCPSKSKHINKSEVRQPIMFGILWDAIIADETHKWLINTRGKKASQVGYGFGKLKSVEDGMRLALTGTPLKGKRENLFGTLNWLRPKVYTSKWRWIEEHFIVFKNHWGGRIIGDMMNEEKFYRRLDSIMIRRTKSELHRINPTWMAPDKVYHDIVIPCEGKQRKMYDMMLEDAEVELDGKYLTATGILAEMTRLKQMAQSYGRIEGDTWIPTTPSNKFDWLIEFLDARGISRKVGGQKTGDLSDDVHKVVLASQFTKLINLYAAELTGMGIQCYVITGETKERDAVRIVERWADEEDPVRVCLINTQAGGVSITLDAADDIVIHDETWVPDESEQAEDRCHRASRVDHQLDVWYLRSEGTMEANIAEANRDKAENNHVVLDARRGLAFARENLGVRT